MMPVANPSTLRRISYAQNREDILLDRLFGDRRGTFLDVGAHHPLHDNNTYFFYQRGWHGVNLEPLPALHRLGVQMRPRDLNLAVGLSDHDGELPFYEIANCNGLSTLTPEIATAHRARGAIVVESRIPVTTLASLVQQHGIEPPDLLSIDVEGHEEQVIRGIPLASWRPQVLVVEATRPLSPVACHQRWEPSLLGHGYLLAAFNGINRFYLRDDLADQRDLLQLPVNVLDNYEPLETALLRQQVIQLQQQLQRLRTVGASPRKGQLLSQPY